MREQALAEVLVFGKDELADNGVRIVEVGSVEIGIFRKAGRYYAYRNLCPHQGGPVCEGVRVPKVEIELDAEKKFLRHGFNAEEMHFVCPWHGWEFKLETGEAAGDPSIRLRRYKVTEKDGNIYVEV